MLTDWRYPAGDSHTAVDAVLVQDLAGSGPREPQDSPAGSSNRTFAESPSPLITLRIGPATKFLPRSVFVPPFATTRSPLTPTVATVPSATAMSTSRSAAAAAAPAADVAAAIAPSASSATRWLRIRAFYHFVANAATSSRPAAPRRNGVRPPAASRVRRGARTRSLPVPCPEGWRGTASRSRPGHARFAGRPARAA